MRDAVFRLAGSKMYFISLEVATEKLARTHRTQFTQTKKQSKRWKATATQAQKDPRKTLRISCYCLIFGRTSCQFSFIPFFFVFSVDRRKAHTKNHHQMREKKKR